MKRLHYYAYEYGTTFSLDVTSPNTFNKALSPHIARQIARLKRTSDLLDETERNRVYRKVGARRRKVLAKRMEA